MSTAKHQLITVYLTDAEVSKLAGRTRGTLRRWRRIGYGPKFVRIQREIRYNPNEGEAWPQSLERSAETGAAA